MISSPQDSCLFSFGSSQSCAGGAVTISVYFALKFTGVGDEWHPQNSSSSSRFPALSCRWFWFPFLTNFMKSKTKPLVIRVLRTSQQDSTTPGQWKAHPQHLMCKMKWVLFPSWCKTTKAALSWHRGKSQFQSIAISKDISTSEEPCVYIGGILMRRAVEGECLDVPSMES